MPLTVAQLVARLTADTSNFYRGMAVANSAMLQSGSIISRVAAGAGLATLGMGIMSLRAAGNFEQSMNIFGAVSDANTRQMKAVSAEAIQLGKDIHLPNVSAKDAAVSMTELAKGGLSVKDSMAAARGTLQLGIAANIAYADSAAIVARALTSFHLAGTDATKVADLFTAAANKSTASASDIALGFQAASAQFHAGDQTIQGLTTSLTLMANAGIVGSDAGTSLKTMMNRLMAPTKKAKDLMNDMGISIYDQAGNMRPMPGLIDQFNHGLQGMTKEQKNAALYTIFGSDAIRAARVQLDAGAKGWKNMEDRLTKGGEAQKYANAATKGFNGALGALGSNVETLAIQLGTSMLPAATKVARAMADFIGNIDPQKIIGFFQAIGQGVKQIYDFISGSTILSAVVIGLVAGLGAYVTIMKTIEIVTKAWAAAQFLLDAAMDANPVVLIIAALIGLGAALYYAYQRSETFRNIVNQAFAAVASAADWVVNAAKIVANAFMTAYNSVANVVRQIVSVVTSAWNAIHSNTAIWNVISAVVTGAINVIKAVLTAQFNLIRAVVSAAWNFISTVTSQLWNVIKTIVVNAIGVITGKISAMTALRNIVGAVWNAVKAITQSAWDGIKTILSTAIEGMYNVLRAAAGAAGAIALSIGKAIVDGILNGVSSLGGALKSKVEGMIGGVLSHINIPGFSPPEHAASEAIGQPLGRGVISGFLLGSGDLPKKMSDSVRAALEAAKTTLQAEQGTLSTEFGRLGDYAMQAFDAATSGHKTKSQNALDALVGKHDAAELKKRLDDAQSKVVDAQKALTDFATQDFDSEAARQAKGAELYKAYLDAQQALTDEKAQQAYDKKVAALQKQADAELLDYTARRNLQKQHLQDELNDLEAALMKHPEKHQFYQNKIIKLLNSYGVNYKSAGLALGNAFAQGMRESFNEVEKTAAAIAALVAKYLRLHSPADAGPLASLDHWFDNFAPTLLRGLDTGAISNALTGAAGMGLGGLGALSGATLMGASGQQTGGTTIVVTGNTMLSDDRTTARKLADILAPFQEGGRIQVAAG